MGRAASNVERTAEGTALWTAHMRTQMEWWQRGSPKTSVLIGRIPQGEGLLPRVNFALPFDFPPIFPQKRHSSVNLPEMNSVPSHPPMANFEESTLLLNCGTLLHCAQNCNTSVGISIRAPLFREQKCQLAELEHVHHKWDHLPALPFGVSPNSPKCGAPAKCGQCSYARVCTNLSLWKYANMRFAPLPVII